MDLLPLGVSIKLMPAKKNTSVSDSILFVLNIDSIHLINTQVLLKDASLKDPLLIRLKELTANLIYAENKVEGFANASGYFEKFDVSEEMTFTNNPLSFKVDYMVDIEDQKVIASSPLLELAKTPLQFDLIFDFASTSSIKLDVGSLKEGLEISSEINPKILLQTQPLLT